MEDVNNLPKNESFAGRTLELTDFRSWFECDVKFQVDGTPVKNTNFGLYYTGNIRHPDDGDEEDDQFNSMPSSSRIGESKLLNDGRMVCLVDVKSCNNVTLFFSDGLLVEGCRYDQFGRSYYGDKKPKAELEQECKLGLSITNQKGDTAEIVAIYPQRKRGKTLVDVMFHKDGKNIPVNQVFFSAFIAGKVMCPKKVAPPLPHKVDTTDGHHYQLVHEAKRNGLVDAFIDQVLVKNIKPEDYLNGTATLPKDWELNHAHIGETRLNNSGQTVKLVLWRTSQDADCLVDGEWARHRTYQNFQRGKIICDRLRREKDARGVERNKRMKDVELFKLQAAIGKTNTNMRGQRYALVSWRSVDDVTVVFEKSGKAVKTTWFACWNGLVYDSSEPELMPGIRANNQEYGTDEEIGKSIFESRIMPIPEKLANDLIERVATDAIRQEPFAWEQAYTGSTDEEDQFAGELNRGLGYCITALRMYAMSAPTEIGICLGDLSQTAFEAASKLRENILTVCEAYPELSKIAKELRDIADKGTGVETLDTSLNAAARKVDDILERAISC